MRDKVTGCSFIHTKEELDIIISNNSVVNTILIRRDFAETFFTPTGLTSYIENVKGLNPNVTIEIDEDSNVITYDYIVKKMSKCRSVEELMHLMVTYQHEFMDVLGELINKRDEQTQQFIENSNQISRLQAVNNELQSHISDLEIALRNEQENKLQFQIRYDALIGRINYQYNAGVDKSKMFVVKGDEYDKVIYFKELSRVQYTDTFLYYLKEIFKVVYGMPTRLVTIESFYATGKIKQYPGLKPHHTLVEEDVLSGDILMLGIQPELMQDILRNPSRISILIVLDRAGYEVPHIIGDNVEYFYMASDLRDVPEDIPKGRVISYSADTLFIKYIKDFEKLDHSQRIAEYSSSNLMKTIFKIVEDNTHGQ